MRAFIIRPLGKQTDSRGSEIDFDEVEAKLIAPALRRLGVTGYTTGEIIWQGNFREDMFQLLLAADLVVADISNHHANIFYELGVRHALRDRHTFLLRAGEEDRLPFDLQTGSYFTYNKDAPDESIEALHSALRAALDSGKADSPVFISIPNMKAQDPARLLAVPHGFGEEVERAKVSKQPGDLELLADEARGFIWETEGLRLVGRAQFQLKAFEGARETWEAVRKSDLFDAEANTLLGTIYQRLGDLVQSDLALSRVLSRGELDRSTRAEVHALMGRNAKTRWMDEWKMLAPGTPRQQEALRSPTLDDSLDAYAAAFNEDLNHFYSGLNALAMLTIQTELARLLPKVWAERFDDDAEAKHDLESRVKQTGKLAAAVELSLKAAVERLKREKIFDVWAEISEADLKFLTLKEPLRIAHAYRNVLVKAPDFAAASVRSQLNLYQELGLLEEKVKAVLKSLGPAPDKAHAVQRPEPHTPPHVLVFTGHMVDAPGRKKPRFPPDKVDAARRAIATAVADEQARAGEIAYGLAGCASGGDILFHQVCEQAGIPTRILLALPPELYVEESVVPAGPEWVKEFYRLTESRPVRVLSESKELPGWLRNKPGYNIWQRNNLWTLHNALAEAGGPNVTLIALWNCEAGDGAGGTADMVEKAKEREARTVILDTNTIFAR